MKAGALDICLMCSSYTCDSATGQIFVGYANHFARRGHRVTLWFCRRPARDPRLDPRVVFRAYPRALPLLPGPAEYNPLEALVRVLHVLRRRYDVVHVLPGHRPVHWLPAWLARRRWGALTVDEWWEWFGRGGLSDDTRGVKRILGALESASELRSKRLYDRILPISGALKDRLPPGLRPRALVLRGGMDDERMRPIPMEIARRARGLDPGAFLVGMSNLCDGDWEDNLPFFRAFRRFAGEAGDAKLVVSGPLRHIEARVAPAVGADRLVVMGWQPMEAYNQFLSACQAFALPFPDTRRNRGRWPNKFCDFLWLRRPVITSPTGELGPILQGGKFGYAVDPTEEGYLMGLRRCNDDWRNGRLPEADPAASGLMTVTERRGAVLALYGRAMGERAGRAASSPGGAE